MEQVRTPSTSQTASPQGPSVKPAVVSNAASPQGDFLSLLSALEVEASSSPVWADAGTGADDGANLLGAQTLTAADMLAQSDAMAAALLQAAQGGAGPLDANNLDQPQLTAMLQEMLSTGLVAETLQMDRADDLGVGAPTTSLIGGGRAWLRNPKMPLSGAGATDASQIATLGRADLSQALANGKELVGIAAPAFIASASDKASVTLPQGMVATREVWTGDLPAVDSAAFATDPAASMLTSALSRTAERGAGTVQDSVYGSIGSTEAQDTAGLPPALTEVATGAGADSSHSGAEDRLAEQVTYWLSQKTQNAELTLDQGGQAVGVFVSLTGNDASIAFSSDQALTREWLDASTSQLRDLLNAQGLSLTDVTVSAQGQSSAHAGGQSSPDRQAARRAQVAVEMADNKAPVVRPSAQAQHKLDVFV